MSRLLFQSPTPFTDPREARRLLFALLSDGVHPIELRCRTASGAMFKEWADTVAEADELAHRLIDRAGHDVYVGLLPRLGRTGEDQRRYAPARALWADCDTARAVHKLWLFEPEPTAIVLSGGLDGGECKRYGYWALVASLDSEQVRRHNLRLAHHLEADAGACDAGRILRVPGSRNHKTGRVARFERFTGEVHSLQELAGDLPDAPQWEAPDEPRQAKTDDELVRLFAGTYHDGEGRHEHFRSVCGVLLRRCDRLAPDVLLELAVCWAQQHTHPCKPRAELERNFDNLLARERTRRGLV